MSRQEEDASWVPGQLNLGRLQLWTDDQQKAAKDLLFKSSDIFSKNGSDIGKCNILKDNIKVTDYQLFKRKI